MQFKPELIEKILAGGKTQMRWSVKPGDTADFDDDTNSYVVFHNGRLKYQADKTYAVCPGRGKRQVARIRILKIRREDVRLISLGDAKAEGFCNEPEFFQTWCGFYDPKGWDIIEKPFLGHWLAFMGRPAHLYDAWALDFELVV